LWWRLGAPQMGVGEADRLSSKRVREDIAGWMLYPDLIILMLGLGVEAEQLRQALQERPSIDVAKGILVAL